MQRATDNGPDHSLAEQCSKLRRRAEAAEASLRQERHRRQRADRDRALALARADEARAIALAYAAGPGAAVLAEPLQGLAEPLRALASQLPALLAAVPRELPALLAAVPREHLARKPSDNVQTRSLEAMRNLEACHSPVLLHWRSRTAHWRRPASAVGRHACRGTFIETLYPGGWPRRRLCAP